MTDSTRATPDQLASLAGFSLLEALFGRRSRRFGAGMTIPDGPLAYQSTLPAQPLSLTERDLLIAAGVGISGWNFAIPYTEAGTPDSGCNYTVRPLGRTFPSGAATHGSELLVIDDTGTYFTRTRDLDPSRMQEYTQADDLLRIAGSLNTHLHRISDQRLDIPREFPHLVSHNRWVANRPGSTLFVPVGDQVESLLNQLWIRIGEGVMIVDHVSGRPLGDPEPLLMRGGLIAGRSASLALIEGNSRVSVTAELAIVCYNIQLMLQALGLGGWLFSGINPISLLGGFAQSGVKGAGFRFAPGTAGRPASPIGLDGVFEPLVPPYVKDMREAVHRFAERKFGPLGNHSANRPSAFRDPPAMARAVDRLDDDQIAYMGSVADDVLRTHGRFPATIPGVAVTTYTQAHHIDPAFYDRFYKDGAYLGTHARHQCLWHDQGSPAPDHGPG